MYMRLISGYENLNFDIFTEDDYCLLGDKGIHHLFFVHGRTNVGIMDDYGDFFIIF